MTPDAYRYDPDVERRRAELARARQEGERSERRRHWELVRVIREEIREKLDTIRGRFR